MNREAINSTGIEWEEVETSQIKVGHTVLVQEADHVNCSTDPEYGSDKITPLRVVAIENPTERYARRFTLITFADGTTRRFKRGNHYAIAKRDRPRIEEYIDAAIKRYDVEALERMLEIHHYSTDLDGEPDMRTLDHIGATPCRLTEHQLARVLDAAETLKDDRDWAFDAWCDLSEDPEEYDGPETIMLSTGYAEVHLDGDVVSSKKVLFNVAGKTCDCEPGDPQPYCLQHGEFG